jgi:glycosyltransferase involved in cell wall biosynthesis
MSETLRVAMLIQAYYPRLGGAERQLASLAPLLKDLGVEIRIFTRRYDRALSPFEIINDVPVYRLPVPGPKPLAALSFSLSAMPMLRSFSPHVIHAHELLSPATTAIMAKRILGIPVVAKVLRGGELGDLAKLKRRAFGSSRIESIKRGIDSFIVISTEIDNELAEIGVPLEKRSFIPNGVDLNRFAPLSLDDKTALRRSLNLPDGLVVVFSGRLDPEKRVNQLIAIWNEIIKKHADATLLILGTGTEEQKLEQMAGANVRFEGNVKDVAPYLRASDIFVLPSSTEGLSNALLEAMASGLASIATSVGGATDLIETGKNGILILPDDSQALLSALLTVLSDSDLRAKFGVNGRSFVQKSYSLSAVAEKLNALYRKFASQQKRR